MRISLVSINSKYIHSSLGVWYLDAVARDIGTEHTVEVYESVINTPIEETVDAIIAMRPDAIGFSCYIWNVEYTLKVAACIKTVLGDVKIFLGGPEATHNAKCLLKENPFVDFIIAGEGEQPFKQLLEHDFSLAYVPAALTLLGGQTEYPPATAPCEKYYNPYSKEYFKRLKGRIAYIESSRGCPFSCSFCLSGEGNNVRFFDMEQTKKNILALGKSGTQTVKFVDRTFNCNEKRALEIMEFIKEQHDLGTINKDITFHCEVGADLFGSKSLEFFKSLPPGLFQFEAGLQSFKPETLCAIRRKTNMPRLVENLEAIAAQQNIHLHIDLIAGLPMEGYESFADGFDKAFATGAQVIQLGFLKLLKGSFIEGQGEQWGYKITPYPPYQVLSSKFISYDELSQLSITEDAVEKLLNSGKFKHTLDYLLEQTSLSPYGLFHEFGRFNALHETRTISLDECFRRVFSLFTQEFGVSKVGLRDVMCLDKMCCDPMGRIPDFLKREDERLKKIKLEILNSQSAYSKRFKEGKAAMFIAYSENSVVIVDYTDKNCATGRFGFCKFPLEK